MSKNALGKADSSTDSSGKEFVCPDCDGHFDSSYLARSHVSGSDCEGFECEVCEKSDFLTKSGLQTHKGMEHGQPEKTCVRCGDKFSVKPHREKEAKYCSWECRKNQVEMECGYCGESYTVAKNQQERSNYCSRACSAKDRVAGWNKKEDVTLECEFCSKEYQVNPYNENKSRFCSRECKHKNMREEGLMRGENSPVWKGGYEPYYGENWLEQRRKARERDNYTCQACGLKEENSEWELSVHHIKPKDEFESLKEANKLSNLVTLCRTCHGKWEGIPLKPTLLTAE